ncbi:hypothetical protein [uncultured Desulfovibrio sp.]|uniref:Uncharacterized protein n=1 Tax=Candidatus Desulfovibrio intestinavium TaxID=2838534 RepID=A0A9D2HLZ9_9BACT|nr:hypothetical protein [uncultured Desulfovibrio sp.]HJA78622.1 hypothetical protein [Candidatus Desulfovibrio intestinavium]
MSDIAVVRLRQRVQGYELQLLAARRLTRLRTRMRLAAGEAPHDPDPSPQRGLYVEKVAQEVYESLLFTGSDNPVVEEIRRALSERVGFTVRFTYPPGEGLCLVRQDDRGARRLSSELQLRVRRLLWRITREKIDRSMLDKPAPVCS